MNLPAIGYFRSLDPKNLPGDFMVRLAETFELLQKGTNNIEQQTNSNAQGLPPAPAQANGLTISAKNGWVHVAIEDRNPVYRGINYHLEHDSSPNFSNPIPEDLGSSRHFTHFIGNQTRYYRVASSYSISGPSPWTYHGTSTQPIGVSGGGSTSGPSFLPSQGSGTGQPGQGLQGPGTVPFRTANGAPPTR